jgi:hypothetical protein
LDLKKTVKDELVAKVQQAIKLEKRIDFIKKKLLQQRPAREACRPFAVFKPNLDTKNSCAHV